MTDKQIKEINEQIKKAVQRIENIWKKYDELREKFKTKEQECEELKKIIDEAKNSKLDLKSFLVGEAVQNEYEQQLNQLKVESKEINEKLKEKFSEYTLKNSFTIAFQDNLINKYKQALTEIKEMCNFVENIENVNSLYDAKLNGMYLQANKILQKISEVLE